MNVFLFFIVFFSISFAIGNVSRAIHYIACLLNTKEEGTLSMSTFKKIAIIIPAYKEERVLRDTVESLLDTHYPHQSKTILLAVYSEDTPTRDLALQLERDFSSVTTIINPSVPMGKAQNLNYALKHLPPTTDIVGFHDAEDCAQRNLHEEACNNISRHNVVQFKVLPEKWHGTMTERTYAIGFAKYTHLYLPAKNKIGVTPLAGTGFYINKKVLESLGDRPFSEGNLAEDYMLALSLAQKGIRVHYTDDSIIREKFPDDFSSCIKQRTRWAIGYLQSVPHIFSVKGPLKKTVLLLDGITVSSLFWIPAFCFGVWCIARSVINGGIIEFPSLLFAISLINTLGGIEEIVVSPYFAYKEYNGHFIGYMKSIVAVIYNNIINSIVYLNAFKKIIFSKLRGKRIEWDKTEHTPKTI